MTDQSNYEVGSPKARAVQLFHKIDLHRPTESIALIAQVIRNAEVNGMLRGSDLLKDAADAHEERNPNFV